MTEQQLSGPSDSRQVVVFVRVNNMASLTTERQETFVIDMPDRECDHDLVTDALEEAWKHAIDREGSRS